MDEKEHTQMVVAEFVTYLDSLKGQEFQTASTSSTSAHPADLVAGLEKLGEWIMKQKKTVSVFAPLLNEVTMPLVEKALKQYLADQPVQADPNWKFLTDIQTCRMTLRRWRRQGVAIPFDPRDIKEEDLVLHVNNERYQQMIAAAKRKHAQRNKTLVAFLEMLLISRPTEVSIAKGMYQRFMQPKQNFD